MRLLSGIVILMLSLTILGFRASNKIAFKQNVSGYLKRSADANTIDMAKQELKRVVDYLEANNLTSGYTSILWQTPDEDISFWYQNLKATLNELENVKSDATTLEKTNILMKLRETLMDAGGEGKEKVTVPDGMSVYPNNKLWAFLMAFALTGLMVSVYLIVPKHAWEQPVKPAPTTSS
ncbi:MAG: hypothetical protein AAGG75_11415 [Bacteroidota bacterium]